MRAAEDFKLLWRKHWKVSSVFAKAEPMWSTTGQIGWWILRTELIQVWMKVKITSTVKRHKNEMLTIISIT